MKLSIVIVSWNVKALLEKCLLSIEEHVESDSTEVIVVDNASSDGTQKMLDDLRFTVYDLRKIFLKENVGFARGNNEGLKHATGDYILFLNPDTEIVGDALQTMVTYMDAHTDIAVIGPKLLNIDGSLQRSVRAFPTLISQLLVLTKIHNFIPRIPSLKKYFALDFDYTKEQPVDQLMGAALMVCEEALGEVGGTFDTGYRRIFEEVDLCYRFKQAGHTIMYVPTAEVLHHKGASFSKTRIFRKQLDFNQGMLRFFKKYKPAWQYSVLVLFQPVSWLMAGLQTLFARIGDPVRKRFKKKEL